MARNHPLTFDEFKSIYSKVPKVCVEAVIKTPKGVVLIKRAAHGWQGCWHFPGGNVHYLESLYDAVKRLALEELGIKVEVHGLIDWSEFFSEQKERGFGYSVTLQFLCTTQNEIPTHSTDAEEVAVFDELPEPMIEENAVVLRKFLAGEYSSTIIRH